jgi:adenosine/AMP kinase
MATGTATLDFGAFPGGSDASVAVTGQTGIAAGSFVEAWLSPAATADHTADEHLVETIKVVAGNISAGVGFTIYGINTSQLNEPVELHGNVTSIYSSSATAIGVKVSQTGNTEYRGGKGTRIYGTWNVSWVWV